MGAYVNPKGMSKESWLRANADETVATNYLDPKVKYPEYSSFKQGNLPVVLVDNGYFTAAAVAFDEKEYKRFIDPSDDRPKIVFSVEKEKLYTVSNLADYLPKGGK